VRPLLVARMTYREVSVIEVKEILRLWLAGHSQREVTTLAGVDRKTVRRYVQAAQARVPHFVGRFGGFAERLCR